MYMVRKTLLSLLFVCLSFWWLPFSLSPDTSHSENSDFVLSHVVDSYSCHFGGVELFLPILIYRKSSGFSCFSSSRLYAAHEVSYQGIKLEEGVLVATNGEQVWDFSITKNVFFMLLSLLLLLLLWIATALIYQRRKGVVRGGWVFPLYLVRFIRDEIAKPNIGETHYKRFTPYLLTLFCYILLNNLLGLLPGAANVTGNLSVVLVLAFTTFLVTNLNGSRYYWKHIFNPEGVPKWILPILVPIEVLGIFIKPITLMFRLFVNMLAGHLLLTAVIGLIFILHNLFIAIIAVPLGVFILLLKIFVSFVQAYVFTLLTALTLGAAVEEH